MGDLAGDLREEGLLPPAGVFALEGGVVLVEVVVGVGFPGLLEEDEEEGSFCL
jgi:hypothetical protein